jgi:uncharacterized damage-inducible protein DinB
MLVVMSRSLLDEAFAHHVWATLRLIETCLVVTQEQLDAAVPGTYGSILETMRHFVGGDALYLFHLTGDHARQIDTDHMDLQDLRDAMEADAKAWIELLAKDLDPAAVVRDVDEAGYMRDASIGVRLAQALNHGTDHRSQICTALTTLGVEPPGIDVWSFGVETGRVVDIAPAT